MLLGLAAPGRSLADAGVQAGIPPADALNGGSAGASWTAPPSVSDEVPAQPSPPTNPPPTGDGGVEATEPAGAAALAAAAESADAGAALSFSDLLNHLLRGGSPSGARGEDSATDVSPAATLSPEPTPDVDAEATTPAPKSLPSRSTGPADQGAEQLASVKPVGAEHDAPGEITINADGSTRDCRSSCGTVFREHNLCNSGWEGQSALCGRGFRGIPGLEPRDSHCLRCISGVCGDCPEGYQTVEEMGVCRAHGECAWGQCSRQSSCSIGYTATESSVCRAGSYFLTKNYCCEDKPKKRCCQALPCQQYSEDCKYWGCDPACRFAVYSLPQSCENPYNPDLRCGSGIEVDGLNVSNAQLMALKPEVGTCLEMMEVCGAGCPDGYTEAECPWPRCETAKANTCSHLAGTYNNQTNSFTKQVTHCWRRQSCGVSNAPSECQRPVEPLRQDAPPTIYDVVTGENQNNCPLFWSENAKCTTWNGRVNECGDPIAGASTDTRELRGQQGTCFQELEVCGQSCPDGYVQLPCGPEGCPSCHWDGRLGLKCVKRHACIPSFSQCDAPDETPPPADDEEGGLRTVMEPEEAGPPAPPPIPEPPRQQVSAPDAAVVELPSSINLLASPRGFEGLELDFFFLDLDIELLQESGSRFTSAFLSRILRESSAAAGQVVSIEPGSAVVTVWLEFSAGRIPSDNFIQTLMDEPGSLLMFINWHDTLRSLGRVVMSRIEYIFQRNPPPPPSPVPPSPPPSPPQPLVAARDEDARAGANFSDLQPVDGVDGVDGLDGSIGRPPSEDLESPQSGAAGADQPAIPNKTGLSIGVLTACVVVGCIVVAAVAIGAFVIVTRRDRRRELRRRREQTTLGVGTQDPASGVPRLGLGTTRNQHTPAQHSSQPHGGLSTVRSHTFEFATGEEDVVIIDDATCVEDCEASHPSTNANGSSTVVVNATGRPISMSGSVAASSVAATSRSGSYIADAPPAEHVSSVLTLEQQQQQRLNTLLVPFSSMVIQQQLARGSLKSVFRGFWNGYIPVAIHKVNAMAGHQAAPNSPAAVLANIQPHPHLVQLFGVSHDAEGTEHLVMEYVRQGPLDAFLLDNPLTYQTKIEIAMQICLAMRHLADAGVVHGNLAARNVLVESADPVLVKVADFGLVPQALPHVSSPTAEALPLRWVPPEVWAGGQWSEKSDVWAFAITLWELHSFTIPYGRLTSDAEVVKFLEAGGRLPKPNSCPEALYDIMRACWLPSPRDRPSFSQLLEILTNLRLLM
eukprot:jgi/Tetstr1/424669/TSEL_015191.t1